MPEFRFREPMSDVALPANARLTYYWLRTLAKDELCSAKLGEIAARVGISEPSCSTQITALEDAGYITRVSAKGLGKGRKRFKICSLFVAAGAAIALETSEPSSAANLNTLQADQSAAFTFRLQRRRRKRRDKGAA